MQIDNTFTLQQVRECNTEMQIAFVDLKKSLDQLPIWVL